MIKYILVHPFKNVVCTIQIIPFQRILSEIEKDNSIIYYHSRVQNWR